MKHSHKCMKLLSSIKSQYESVVCTMFTLLSHWRSMNVSHANVICDTINKWIFEHNKSTCINWYVNVLATTFFCFHDNPIDFFCQNKSVTVFWRRFIISVGGLRWWHVIITISGLQFEIKRKQIVWMQAAHVDTILTLMTATRWRIQLRCFAAAI